MMPVARTQSFEKLTKPVFKGIKSLIVTSAILDKVIAELAALSLDDLVSEVGDLSLDSGGQKVNDLAFDFGCSSPNHQTVEQSGALVCRGSRYAPLHMQYAIEGLQKYIDLKEEPDETMSNIPTGFYTSTISMGKWAKYSDFIPGYLQQETQLALRRKLTKLIAENEYGHMYPNEGDDMPLILRIKIGHAVDVQARLNSLKSVCGKTKLKRIGWYPGNIEDENLGAKLLRMDRFEPAERGEYCRGLERLVHIELADLAMHTLYLSTDLSNGMPITSAPQSQVSRSSSLALNVPQKTNGTCDSCE
ncbi:hypothetical protein ACEPAI_5398 [Sanghuangporus weigelae]